MEIRKSVLITVSVVTIMTGLLIAAEWESDLIYFDGNGKLVYAPEPYSGHRIGDFSHAGYMGGGIDLPTIPTVLTISSTGGDDTALIQNAIDTVSALTPDGNGIRGALLLQSGTYNINASLYVTTSGVVLRGEGDGGGGGYNVDNTVRAWALAWTVLCGADADQDKNPPVGGVMLGSTEWQGGLRDRELAVSQIQRETVIPKVEATIELVKAKIFPIHGLK
jgi:hypothetical protein